MVKRPGGPLFTEAAYPTPEDKQQDFKRFLQDRVRTFSSMRGNYGPHTDAVRVLSASVLGTALELVYASPIHKDPDFERQRNKAIMQVLDKTLPLDPHEEPYEVLDEQVATLETVDPHIPKVIELLEQMHGLGLDEDIYTASLKSLVYLAEKTDFFMPN